MRSSSIIVHTLLEDGDDMGMDADELLHAADVGAPFDEGAAYVMRQARSLYMRLAQAGALEMVRGVSPDGVAQADAGASADRRWRQSLQAPASPRSFHLLTYGL